jgi:hypothetical protein
MHPNLRRGFWLLVLLPFSVVLIITAFLPANKLLVNHSCELSGLSAKLKSEAQGRYFWASQLKFLEKRIAWHSGAPERVAQMKERHAALNAKADRIIEASEQRMQKIRDKDPSFTPPSPREVEVESLRDQADTLNAQADALELDGLYARMKETSADSVQRLEACRPEIEAWLYWLEH